MKICMLTTSFPGHYDDIRSPFLLELCQALSNEGVRIDVISPQYTGTKKEERIGNIFIHRFSYFWPKRMQVLTQGGGIPSALRRSWLAKIQFPFFYLALLMKSLRYGKDCDIVHAQWSFAALAGIVLKILYGKPMLMTERGASANLAMQHWLMKGVLKFLARHSDFITANSAQQTELFFQLGEPRERVKTILNGIDTQKFKPHHKTTCRKTLALPKDKKIILFVGWLIERKGVEYLIEAVRILSEKRKDILCVLVGEGNQEQKLKDLVYEYDLKDNIIFVGSVSPSRVPLYMNAADVFVLPSLSEGKPNVVAEAMACGVPVVATAVAGTNELLRDGVNGYSVQSKKPDEIVHAVNMLFDNPILAQKLAHAGHDTILKGQLTWKTCAREYLTLYKKLLS